MLLGTDVKEWLEYYWGGKRLTPTGQIITAEHRSSRPLKKDMRMWQKYYLGEKRDPDKLDNFGKPPLFYAAKKGHEGVVRILLER